jgi:hypothetical protein
MLCPYLPLLSLLTSLLACGGPPAADQAEAPPPVFVRGGYVLPADAEGGTEGTELPDGRRLVLGEHPEAPRVSSCVPLFHVDLGDVSAGVARGGAAPDTAVAFSHDGRWLAVGTALGEVLVVDAHAGTVRARRTLAEALVRTVRWSADDATLLVGEQSPDANLYALSPDDLHTVATLRLADHVQTSAPPPADDLYGVYTLPGVYALEPMGDEWLVSGVHGWNTDEGRKNQSRLLRVELAGDRFETVAAWPPQGAADAVFGGVAVGGKRVAVAIRRSAEGPAPKGLPVDGVQVLDDRLVPQRVVRYPVLEPHFDSVFVWEALALVGQTVFAGMGDGRVAMDRPGTREVLEVGSPVMAGDVPVVASIGHLKAAGDEVYVVTARSNIPWGVERPEARPPSAHPGENRLWAWSTETGTLEPRFAFGSEHDLAGLTVRGRQAIVGAGPRQTDERTDLFGVLAFDLDDADAPLRAICRTEGPVFWRHDLADDGRIAAVEVPWRQGEEVRGAYRLTVLR